MRRRVEVEHERWVRVGNLLRPSFLGRAMPGARLCKNQLINKPFVGQHGQGRGDAHMEWKKGKAIEGVDKKTYFLFIFKTG